MLQRDAVVLLMLLGTYIHFMVKLITIQITINTIGEWADHKISN
jgi:hypothetical protein